MKLSKLAAVGGVAGPVLFTVAWVVGSLRQTGHSVTEVQLSGLAAEDARDPQIMMAGFVVLGACSVAFGGVLGRRVAPRSAGPWLVMAGGAAAIAAGVFRRDHMLLTGPGFAGESWHNQVHDMVSGVAYGAMLVAPLVLGRHFGDDPHWAVLSRPVQALGLASAAALAVFASGVAGPWNGVVQRAAVTLALAAEVAVAARMLTRPPVGSPARPAARPSIAPSPGRRHGGDELRVEQGHARHAFRGARNVAGGIEDPAGVLVAAVGLIQDLEQMSCGLLRSAGGVPEDAPVVLERIEPITHPGRAGAHVGEAERGPVGEVSFGRRSTCVTWAAAGSSADHDVAVQAGPDRKMTLAVIG